MVRRAIAFLITLAVLAALATLATTYVSQPGLPVGDWLSVAGRNLVSTAPTLLMVLAPAALVTFLIAGAIVRFPVVRRPALYGLAGAAAVVGVHVLLLDLFPVILVGAQALDRAIGPYALAGFVGGLVFAAIAPGGRAPR